MNSYRERLDSIGMLREFERARSANNSEAMQEILERSQFTPLEIESILWSKGDIGSAPTEDERKKNFWDAAIGRIGTALISGVILGGVFAYASSGFGRTEHSGGDRMDAAMSDYRNPKEAYYRPFVWGFVIGAVGGLVTGAIIYDPTSKKT